MSDLHHDPAHRVIAQVDGYEADRVYLPQAGAITGVHTSVPAGIGGHGMAAALVKAALEFARAAGMKVVPRCSCAAAYIRKHPEYAELLV
jgi:predicted GNAT family acetyltransferase